MTVQHAGSRLPPGQYETPKWPVLYYGGIPRIDLATWEFFVAGEVEAPRRWTWAEFTSLPRTVVRCDIHCVTAWSRFDNTFEGVSAAEVLRQARVRPEAGFVMVESFGGYTTNLPLAALLDDDVVLAFTHDGQPLTPEHGGPCRMITPQLYAWKGAKWIRKITLTLENEPGFWERRGYSNTAHPWYDDRYDRG